MSYPLAPGSGNVVKGTTLRLCAMHFKTPPPPEKPKDGGPSPSDKLLDCISFELLKEGYVILVMTADGMSSMPPDAANAVAARTTSTGQLLKIEEGELDGGVPSDPERVLWFPQGSQFQIFWTHDKNLFKGVWEAVKADAGKAVASECFQGFTAAPGRGWYYKTHAPFKLHAARMVDLLIADANGELDGITVHGFYNGFQMKMFGAKGVEEPAHYLIGRSDAVAAMYVATLVNLQALELRAKTMPSWEVFEGVRDIVRQTESMMRVDQLEQALMTIEYGGRRYPANVWNQSYRDYAYACAKARVPRSLFWRAVSVLLNDDDWKKAANEIWRQYQLEHPSTDENGRFDYKFPNKEGVVHYFDFYDFGYRQANARWTFAAKTAQVAIDGALRDLCSRVSLFLAKRAP
jgi:hypothetical protein